MRGGDHRRPAQVLTAQSGLDPIRLGLDVAAAGLPERRGDLTAGQSGREDRVGRLAEQLEGIDGVEVVERLQRGWEILTQRVPQPLGGAGTFERSRSCVPGQRP